MILPYFIPDGPELHLTLSSIPISWQSHIYYACEHISRMFLISALFHALPKYSKLFEVFFALEVITLVDYMVRYNEYVVFTWLDINTVKLVVYGIMIGKQVYKNSRDSIYESQNS